MKQKGFTPLEVLNKIFLLTFLIFDITYEW